MKARGHISLRVVAIPMLGVIAAGVYLWLHPQADSFLGYADFEGAPIAASSPVVNGSQSTYNGFVTFTNLDRTMVASLLPSGFQLAQNKSFFHKTKHPVLLIFGDQTDGALVVGGSVQPAFVGDRAHYSEMIFAIPFVQRIGQGGWHTYIIRMFLDNQLAVNGGELYGYAKVLACLEWKGDLAEVYWKLGTICPAGLWPVTPILEAELQFDGPWHSGPSGSIPNLDDMVGIVTGRILGRRLVLGLPVSVCSHFEWDLTDARVAKAKTTYSMKIPFRSDMTAWPGLGQLPNVTNGAMAVRGVRWRLAHQPVPCGFP